MNVLCQQSRTKRREIRTTYVEILVATGSGSDVRKRSNQTGCVQTCSSQ